MEVAGQAFVSTSEAFVSMETMEQVETFQEVMTPSRVFGQPASVETAMPARLASPQRYRAPQSTLLSPVRTMPLSTTVSMPPVVTSVPWQLPDSQSVVSVTPYMAPSSLVMEPGIMERVQVPRQFGRSPDTILRDMGLSSSGRTTMMTAPMEVRRATSPQPTVMMPSVVETIVREPVPAQVTVVEKVIEQQGMSAQEMQVWLQGERSRLSGAMQEIMTQQSKILTEVINEEVHKVIHMVNAVSNSCEERLVRLEADRSARATAFQGLKRDVDGVQAQIADLEQFRMIGMKNDASREREEVMSVLESVTKDIRNQHRSVLSGLSVQKDLQQKLEGALSEVRGDMENVVTEVNNQRATMAGLSSQRDLLILQKDQQTIDKAIVELRRQTQQSLEVVRNEFGNEVVTIRTQQIGGLSERVSAIENRRLDQDVQELTRLINTERSGRNDLSQTLDAYRATHLQTCAELRAEIDSWPEKLARVEMAVVEERGARERTLVLEQTVNEIRNSIGRRFGDIEAKLDASSYIAKDMQELKKLVNIEQSERSDLAQSFDTHRKSQQQMASELRAEIERSLQEIRRMSAMPAEDKSSRDRCTQLEKNSQEIRSLLSRRVTEVTTRLDVFEGSGVMAKEMEELTRQVRAENVARVDISQTLDAYRMAHLQTSTELRADVDVALEKLSRLESMGQAAARNEERSTLFLGTSVPTMLTPQAGPLAAARVGFGSSMIGFNQTLPSSSSRPAGLMSSSVAYGTGSPGLASTTFAYGTANPAVSSVAYGTGSPGLASTTFAYGTASPAVISTNGGAFESPASLGTRSSAAATSFAKFSTSEILVEERFDAITTAKLDADLAEFGAGGGLANGLLTMEDSAGGFGRGFGSAAAMSVTTEVAEVLADERRLMGRGNP